MEHSKLLHGAFEQYVLSDTVASRVALIHKDQHITYHSLNTRANQLANYLIAQGIQPGAIIGIYFYPCVDQIISLLAILKIGAAYLPLDINYPSDRINYMLLDSSAALILSHSTLSMSLQHETTIVFVDQLGIYSESDSSYPPSVSIKEDDLCYVIYTSGTTGQPKGVMIEHRNATNTVSQMSDVFSLTPNDNILLNTSLGFDPSVWMLFWPLSLGASVIISETEKDPHYFSQMIREHHIKVFHAGPSLFRVLLNQSKIEECTSLRLIIGGGEAWQPLDFTILKQKLPWCDLCNVYGPTEASIHVSFWRSEGNAITISEEIPIGKPIRNMHVLLLDENRSPSLEGEVGELYLGGAGVGRGYLNNSKLTNEKFVFITNAQGTVRYFKTGDLAKRLPDGNLIFLGRIDDQIKLRGFRIEPSEIENKILAYGLFKSVVVLGYKQNNIVTNLLAFIVPKDSIKTPEPLVITLYLKKILPTSMIPSHYIFLNELPRTTHEKIDKGALLSIFERAPVQQALSNYETMADPIHTILAGLWSKILKIGNVEINQHFFDLGGDSLLALDLISEINSYFQLELSVTSLFDYPTIEAFSCHLQEMTNIEEHSSILIRTQQQLSPKNWPLSDNQRWLLRMAKGSLSINNIVVPVQFKKSMDQHSMQIAVTYLLKTNPLLTINILKKKDEYQMGLVDRKINDMFVYIDATHLNLHEQEALLYDQENHLNSQLVNLESDPLFKVVLVNCSSDKAMLFIYTHHLISDPTSGALLLRDLLTYYQNINLDSLVADEDKPSFFDYIAHEIEHKNQNSYQDNLNTVSNIMMKRNWIVNLGNVSETDLSANFTEILLPASIATDIKYCIKKFRVTPFVFLLAILKLVLFDIYRQEMFAVGFNLSRRSQALWSNMIGPLSEQAVSLVDFSTITSFSDLLKITSENINFVYSKSVSIECILREIQVQNPVITDLFNVLFDYEKKIKKHVIGDTPLLVLSPKPSLEVRRHLTVRVVEDDSSFILQFRYRKSLLDAHDIDTVVTKFLLNIKNVMSLESEQI